MAGQYDFHAIFFFQETVIINAMCQYTSFHWIVHVCNSINGSTFAAFLQPTLAQTLNQIVLINNDQLT